MTGSSISQGTPGIDLARLAAWFAVELPVAGQELQASLLAGGRSNLTYAVTDGELEWIVRRPPLGHVLETAHDMAREYRVISALQGTPVPVPEAYALCTDVRVMGAPFYVMERCAGRPYRRAVELVALGAERTREISSQLVDVLASLHLVDPVSVGLGDFGRPEGFLGRQVRRWKKQLDSSYSRALPAAEELYARLARDVPVESTAAIVHGDYRLDNVLVDERCRASAVLDWEMATIGDPLTDLAVMMMYYRLGEALGPVSTDAASAKGFLAEDEIVARYCATAESDLPHFGFYLGLAAFKLAAILEGIHFRQLTGQLVGESLDDIGNAIHPLLDAGLIAMREYR